MACRWEDKVPALFDGRTLLLSLGRQVFAGALVVQLGLSELLSSSLGHGGWVLGVGGKERVSTGGRKEGDPPVQRRPRSSQNGLNRA